MTTRQRHTRAISARVELERRNFLILLVAGALRARRGDGSRRHGRLQGALRRGAGRRRRPGSPSASGARSLPISATSSRCATSRASTAGRCSRFASRCSRSSPASASSPRRTRPAGSRSTTGRSAARASARQDAVARVLALGALEYAVLAPAAMICAVVLLFGTRRARPARDDLPVARGHPGLPRRALGQLAEACRPARPTRATAGVSAMDSRTPSPGSSSCAACWPRRARTGSASSASSLYWLGDIACLWAALKIYNAEVSGPGADPRLRDRVRRDAALAAWGGAGLVEVMMTFALVWVGVPLAPALLGVVTYRAFNFWLPVIPALAALPAVRRMRAGLPSRREGVRPLESLRPKVSGSARCGSVSSRDAPPAPPRRSAGRARGDRDRDGRPHRSRRELPDGQPTAR